MAFDPMEHLLGDDIEDLEDSNIGVMESSNDWTTFRNNLANEMYEDTWRHHIPSLKENCLTSIDNCPSHSVVFNISLFIVSLVQLFLLDLSFYNFFAWIDVYFIIVLLIDSVRIQ